MTYFKSVWDDLSLGRTIETVKQGSWGLAAARSTEQNWVFALHQLSDSIAVVRGWLSQDNYGHTLAVTLWKEQ